MKNAFTLIELLGVIALLGILALIAVPIVDSSLNKSKENLASTQEKQIIKGAKDMFSEHLKCLPNSGKTCDLSCANCGSSKTTCQIPVTCLQEKGYVDIDLKNPKTGEEYSVASYVEVTQNDNNFKYKFVDEEN